MNLNCFQARGDRRNHSLSLIRRMDGDEDSPGGTPREGLPGSELEGRFHWGSAGQLNLTMKKCQIVDVY